MSKTASYGLFIDFGSTFTKLILIDFDAERIVSRTQSPSTVDTDIMLGLNTALDHLNESQGQELTFRYKLACSSAAGGLRMVTIGLVPELTVEAGKRAALGAGAKVVGVYSYQLTKKELQELESIDPVEAIQLKTHLGAPLGLDWDYFKSRTAAVKQIVREERKAFNKAISKLLGVSYPLDIQQ